MKEAWQETMKLADQITNALIFARTQEPVSAMSGLKSGGLKSERLDFSAAIEAILKVFEPLLKKQGNTLTSNIAKLPPIKGNTEMLNSVLINLLTNANRHTENGIIDVQWSAVQDIGTDEHHCLQVTDNGQGIEPHLLPNIFEHGVSGINSSGLGLAIIKKIMTSHNGEVLIESEVGKGTVVRLLFPVQKD
jgi:signal transduction histidine kinase